MTNSKTKIAILGGGIGALTAAFELTEHDPDSSLYDITIYTLGWRLGGKAAVGRDATYRILEHGLHVWAGFYDNAFDLVQRVYAGLGYPKDAWRQAFAGLNHFTVMDYFDGKWEPWLLQALPNGFDPGIAADPPTPFDAIKILITELAQAYANSGLSRFVTLARQGETPQMLKHIFPRGRLEEYEPPISLAKRFAETLPDDPRLLTGEQTDRLSEILQVGHEELHGVQPAAFAKGRDRRAWILFDLALGLIRGMLRDRVFLEGYDQIDKIEWSEWMNSNRCLPESIQSAPVRACYDYLFGYCEGKRAVGAGTGTRALLRFLLTYKGSILYTLRSPMGDFLFVPLYKLLLKRHVKFEFFHRVDKLCLSEDNREITRIDLTRQVELKNPPYSPLIKIPNENELSWPKDPIREQIRNGEKLRCYDLESAWTDWPDTTPRTLRKRSPGRPQATTDSATSDEDTFDIAILGIGCEALRSICGDFPDKLPEWRKFFDTFRTTATIALQLWLKPTTEQLGWPDPRTLLTAFEKLDDEWRQAPLPTWEDRTEVLPLEDWSDDNAPGSLGYFVGVFPDLGHIPKPGPYPEFPEYERQRAREAVIPFMEDRLPSLWPESQDPYTGKFCWDLLTPPNGSEGTQRLDTQYLRVNINPSDRYALSVPGSVQYRLRAHRSGIGNLFLAGDWVRTGLSAGCIEAAVMAGREAARAITGANMRISGNDFDDVLPPISLLPFIKILNKLKHGVAAGVGVMDGCCAIRKDMSTTDVAKLLPPGLRLSPLPPGWSPPNTHPVVLLFARQRNVRPGLMPFGGMNYHEFVQLIPYVAFAQDAGPAGGPFGYMPSLALDQVAPVLIGVSLYGFNKRLAQISSHPGSFEIRSDCDEIRVSIKDEELPGRISDFPNLKNVRALVEQPLISRARNRAWVFSYLDLCFGTASFQAVSVNAKFNDSKPIPFKSIVDDSFGAFRFQTKWALSIPFSGESTSHDLVPTDLQSFISVWRQATLGRLSSRF